MTQCYVLIMLSYRQIEAFRAVFVLRSMTRAADAMMISQPAVSRLIRDMEAAIGLKLFLRRKGGLDPTDEAKALFTEVERSFIGIDKIETTALRIRERHAGDLRICAVPALCHSFLPEVIRQFLNSHDSVRITLHTFNHDTIVASVRTRQFDLGYVMTPTDLTGVSSGTVRRARCACILPPGHRLADRPSVSIEDLRDETFISLGEGGMTRLMIDTSFQAANVTRNLALEALWSVSICGLVKRGLGVSIIEPFTAAAFAAEGGIVKPLEPAIEFSFVAVFPKHATYAPLVTAFHTLFDKLADNLCARSV